jgi:hypothetical protein
MQLQVLRLRCEQQLEMLQSNPSPAELAEKTIDYAEAKAKEGEGGTRKSSKFEERFW